MKKSYLLLLTAVIGILSCQTKELEKEAQTDQPEINIEQEKACPHNCLKYANRA